MDFIKSMGYFGGYIELLYTGLEQGDYNQICAFQEDDFGDSWEK